ncbi:ImmA/IrrE family metallo-endopeptidase [Nitratidesulfovibrio liaohensis]|uniref:ImmA/IrrE family metallo-endopeptidase n=1 Tax=Nitratidesulfovibrio liaohensis TaxID=2604158 RepID=UPI00141FA40F|nr:hypothetical protein [Nitratidesulfovibrio liaohensis]NHZ46425.1 hypothetical protein [Nitratidesulfovibrio liaohensis]
MAPGRIASIVHRVIKRYGLTYPLNIRAFAAQIATVRTAALPEGMDGFICYYPPPKPPYICVRDQYIPRLHFTLAHELGHFFIPWHPRVNQSCIMTPQSRRTVSRHESEADEFAGELLAPVFWMQDLLAKSTLKGVFLALTGGEYMSLEAACVNLSKFDVPLVVRRTDLTTGKSRVYRSQAFYWLALPEADIARRASSAESLVVGRMQLDFYLYERQLSGLLPVSGRTAKDILQEILAGCAPGVAPGIQSSGHASIAALNGSMRGHSAEDFYTRCLANLRAKAELAPLTRHPLFELFVSERCRELIAGRKK